MRFRLPIPFVIAGVGVCFVLAAVLDPKEPSSSVANAAERPIVVPTFFEAHADSSSDLRFSMRGASESYFFTDRDVRISLDGPVRTAPADAGASLRTVRDRYTVRIDFSGSKPCARVVGEARRTTLVSRFVGSPESWTCDRSIYGRLTYRELWPGIDLRYDVRPEGLKSELVVAANADVRDIRFTYSGATVVTVTDAGVLCVETPFGTIEDSAPIAFQQIDGEARDVPVQWIVERQSDDTYEVSFAVVPYDTSVPLVIDPVMLVYSGFIGGEESDSARDVALDTEGNAYIVGSAASDEMSFPVEIGPGTVYSGGLDAVVMKVSASGTDLVYCGYIGGAGRDTGRGIAVDDAGAAYVVGTTESSEATFPVVIGPDGTHNGGIDAFVAKVSPSGSTLEYCGYVGGQQTDGAFGVAVDATGRACLTGSTASSESSFPVVVGPDLTYNGALGFVGDAFVARVAADGSALDLCGYIGGEFDDEGKSIALDSEGNLVVTGWTDVGSFPPFPTEVGPDVTPNGSTEAFVTRVRTDGLVLLSSGYIGGADSDWGLGVALDANDDIYVVGSTRSAESTFPVFVGPGLVYRGCDFALPEFGDGFVAKITAAGDALVYAGYIGGEMCDQVSGVSVDAWGNAYVVGTTSSDETTFPVVEGPDLTYNGGTQDGFVAKVTPDGTTLPFCGYIGGDRQDIAYAVASNDTGAAVTVGRTPSDETTFPVLVGPDLTQNDLGGGGDAFVHRLQSDQEPAVTVTAIPRSTEVLPGQKLKFDVTITNATALPVTTGVWLDVYKPNGNPYPGNPVAGTPRTLRLAPGQVLSRVGKLPIPASTPPSGPYRLDVVVGSFPFEPFAADDFLFSVVE